jgi:hypothetical protein
MKPIELLASSCCCCEEGQFQPRRSNHRIHGSTLVQFVALDMICAVEDARVGFWRCGSSVSCRMACLTPICTPPFLFGAHDLSPLFLRLAQARLRVSSPYGGSKPRQSCNFNRGAQKAPPPNDRPETGSPSSIEHLLLYRKRIPR